MLEASDPPGRETALAHHHERSMAEAVLQHVRGGGSACLLG